MTALIILCSLILASLIVVAVLLVLLYNRLTNLLVINGAYQSEDYRKAVEIQKHKKPAMPAVKEQARGRSVTSQEDLVDIADLDFETGYKALEDIGNG